MVAENYNKFDDVEELKFLLDVKEVPYVENDLDTIIFDTLDNVNEAIRINSYEYDNYMKNHRFYRIAWVGEKVVDKDNEKITQRYFVFDNRTLHFIPHTNRYYDYTDKERLVYRISPEKWIYLTDITIEDLDRFIGALKNSEKDIGWVLEHSDLLDINLLSKMVLEGAVASAIERFPKIIEEEHEEVVKPTSRRTDGSPSFIAKANLTIKGYSNNIIGTNVIYNKQDSTYLKTYGFDLNKFMEQRYRYDYSCSYILYQMFAKFRETKFDEFITDDVIEVHYFKDNRLRVFKMELLRNSADNRNRERKLVKHFVVIDEQRYFVRKNLLNYVMKSILDTGMTGEQIINFVKLLRTYTIRQVERLTEPKLISIEIKEFGNMKLTMKFQLYHDSATNEWYWNWVDMNKKRVVSRYDTTQYTCEPLSHYWWGSESAVKVFEQLKVYGITRKEMVDFLRVKYKEYQLREQRARELLDKLTQNNVKVERVDTNTFYVCGVNKEYNVHIKDNNRVEVSDKNGRYICIVDGKNAEGLNIYDRAITRILSLLNDDKLKKNIHTLN